MLVETQRLVLLPLTPDELRLLAYDLPALEKKLSLSYRAEPLEGFFLDIVKGQLAVTEKDAENYCWHSFWLLIRREDRVAVGSADFKAPPDADGAVEMATAFPPNLSISDI